MRIRVHPGDGLIARFEGTALVLLDANPSQRRIADELLRLVESSAEAVTPPGRRLARQVVRMLSDVEPEEVPAFGLLAQAEKGVVLMLHGDIDADVTSPAGNEHLSGRRVSTWVDRILEPPVTRLVIGPSGQPLRPPDQRVHLRSGVVPGGGLTATAGDATGASVFADAGLEEEPDDETKVDLLPALSAVGAPPEPAPPPAFVSVLLSEAEPAEVREPLPVAGPQSRIPGAAEGQGQGQGRA